VAEAPRTAAAGAAGKRRFLDPRDEFPSSRPRPPQEGAEPALRLVGIEKSYRMAGEKLEVLRGVDLEVSRGMILAILGASGAGKSTLLHVAGGLDRPEAGTVWVAGRDLSSLDAEGRSRFRARHLGFVFQFHHLLPEFTALENVMMPALLARAPENEARARAAGLLERVGLTSRMRHRPSQLSGGEQQRVAVARALVNRPALVLADEPSGNLDRENAERLHALLVSLSRDDGHTVVVATHDARLATLAARVLVLDRGRIREADAREAGATTDVLRNLQ
jgi:lipoprotein-releasing system ATP-binding protein